MQGMRDAPTVVLVGDAQAVAQPHGPQHGVHAEGNREDHKAEVVGDHLCGATQRCAK